MPFLPAPYAAYGAPERVSVRDPARKLAAIALYPSQLGADPDHDWLTTFARREEPFWPEDLTCVAGHCTTTATPPQTVSLSPSAPDGDAGAYHLHLDGGGEQLLLTRGERLLRHWTLPLAGRDRAHSFEVTVAVRELQNVTELTVARDGSLLGVAIEPLAASGAEAK